MRPTFAGSFVRPLVLGLLGLVAVGVVLRWAASDPTDADNPAYDALSRAHSRRMAADALALDSARAALTSSAKKVTITITRYGIARDTVLKHLTDTVKVREFVAAADSTVRACTELVESCAVFRVRAESSIAGLTLDRDTYKNLYAASRPSGLARAWDRLKVPLALTLGVYIGAKAVR